MTLIRITLMVSTVSVKVKVFKIFLRGFDEISGFYEV